MTANYYSSEAFEAKYTYEGTDLGAVWSKDKTAFRLWAPTAQSVKLRLYASGTHGTDDLLEQIPMKPDVKGTWVAEKQGDLHGVYYTYLVETGGIAKEACDPYARTTGVNGRRAMVIDLASCNPEGWESDRNPHGDKAPTDAVIYELHIRDVSCDRSSGIAQKGKYLGLAQTGTVNSYGQSTGLDHIRNLGVTHVQLLPVYDFGSVDESHPDDQYNWGYDPLNYNVPEGSYATDPYHGEVRVRELKQMIKTLHSNGIGVIMDVVYNHVYDAHRFCFNRIVPEYFSRTDKRGKFSAGSGCGNDTATERSMVRKYIIDSVKYWASEYHIDGFRFDLAGLMDTDTIRSIMEEVHRTRPDVLFYGEGWDMDTHLTKSCHLATQQNAHLLPGFAFFNDGMRDVLKGSVFDNNEPGYVSGAWGLEQAVSDLFRAKNGWSDDPGQTINYASCHDNMALFDRITQSAPDATAGQRIRMNRLAAAIYLMAQGIPLMQAGEEMLRSKPLPDGGFDANSYHSSDAVNSLKWDDLGKPEYRQTLEYYKGLIALRRACGLLRRGSSAQVDKTVRPIPVPVPNVTAFQIGSGGGALLAVFNPNRKNVRIRLPRGRWSVCVDEQTAGTETIACAAGAVTVRPISALVLMQEKQNE